MGMDTWHATANCDYAPGRGNDLHAGVLVYLFADVNEDNVEELLAEDGAALFPIPGQADWILAQQGFLW